MKTGNAGQEAESEDGCEECAGSIPSRYERNRGLALHVVKKALNVRYDSHY